ncbi:hypothetical protein TSAR_016179 [Trichomalopsis sarcophagae]|uniref:Uncharacterized protein n=1 Tax=Trichomalopsis sarcophagae TaxID=543379 RepID=A0A232EF53_9HYME|nr:hypothetical protein TSAR_016179 [Trichomalopsis sarcophagae]
MSVWINFSGLINCVISDSVDLTEAVLKESLEGVCEVMKEELINPKIKIVGFDNYLNWSPAVIESDINSRNFSSFSNKGIALHTYKNKHSDTTTVLMQVPSDVYKFIKENNSKIYIGCQIC